MTTPFEKIAGHCEKSAKSIVVRDLAFSVYCQQYETLSKDVSLTPDAINKILLSEPNLISHIRTAEEAISAEVERNEAKIRREIALKGFGMSIVSGVVGNIAYSVLLLLVFFLARDQISSWLSSVAASST
ncbi:hypothetical protein [Stenotrophomonas maltophilia]|uniref:hypothetical protein n=1 Tax=Stenotrophomonas maltophilia TaxID=40324 RepID=UPI0028047246|nr:hypothetical protein [Stenotrophomonas maltophilia]WME84443.1 hypothetical protein RBI20_08965 [Stenotrophomonas maltophilia]